ncbi:MAG: NAD-dependent epimerase/dehydratase family protein [Zetaproteobacteria bacterium]|nr:MAG: NAD-dependent epimerase/dehydratase family protein [Zetaproteobacteria bacterium]
MRILVTGGNGSIGRELVPALLTRGHEVVVLDREVTALSDHHRLRLIPGGVEDPAAVAEATRDVEAIAHLAWSFADDPMHLLEHDLHGHLRLLEAARREKVRRFLYASTAVVYGKPTRQPVDEDHPLLVLAARKPAYGIAKEFAEKLTLLAAQTDGPPAAILRFWWAFGREIGGRHLREMLRTAAAGETVAVPADCGGSFLSLDDFIHTVELLLGTDLRGGQVFNLASGYVTWKEIARLVIEVTASTAPIRVVPRSEWTGAAFLADRWDLDDRRIRTELGFKPTRDAASLRLALRDAIAATWKNLRT